ncbi:hypothetical protein [Undibacterium sp. TS12]|nr:hypothetical protein [Undibacterium sp. TS12]MCH8620333.1 hypothetical protein [Undibacterium sp. TS12]
MADPRGRARIMMLVTPEGQPMLNFLDENGKIMQSFPQVEAAAPATGK